ncbi:hypothetical protein KKH43_03085 [Patescibacteria group bacterium]|nr:hypothetical protein [Patescibacteria group bacterium]
MSIEEYQGLSHEELADEEQEIKEREALLTTIEEEGLESVLVKADPAKHNWIAQKMIDAGEAREVAQNIEGFAKLDNNVAQKLIEINRGWLIPKSIEKFPDLNHQEFVIQMITAGEASSVAHHLKEFTGLDFNAIALKLFEVKQGYLVDICLEDFSGLDKTVALKLIDVGYGKSVGNNLKKFTGLDREVALALIEADAGWAVGRNIQEYSGLDKDVVLKLVKCGFGWSVAENLEKFKDIDRETALVLLKKMIEIHFFTHAQKVNERFPDKIFTKAAKDFGGMVTLDIYEAYAALLAGEIPEEAKALGVKHAQEAGINELRNKLRRFQNELLEGNINPELILELKILEVQIQAFLRFRVAEWGNHDDESFRQVIKIYLDLQKEKELAPLPPEYKSSKKVIVAKVNKEKQAEFTFSEDFVLRYGTLLRSIKEARCLIEDPGALNELLSFIDEKRAVLLKRLQEEVDTEENPVGKENLKGQIERLHAISLELLKSPQEVFEVLSAFKGEFDEELREIMFYFGFYLNPREQQKNISEFDEENPTLDQLSYVLNFIDHITNKETLKKFFTDKNAAKSFGSLLNLKALMQEMARFQNQETKGTMPMMFVLSRDLLTEFSGYTGDACWASKYASILKEFPNLVSLTMVQNPDHPRFERIAGSCLLFETQSKDSGPLLVIRGLNPQETVINQLNVQDFVDNLKKFLVPIAEKGGRKLAIVIDDHSGGAGTNRPVLFDYLYNVLRQSLTQVKPDSKEDTEFNNYDIREDCYLL